MVEDLFHDLSAQELSTSNREANPHQCGQGPKQALGRGLGIVTGIKIVDGLVPLQAIEAVEQFQVRPVKEGIGAPQVIEAEGEGEVGGEEALESGDPERPGNGPLLLEVIEVGRFLEVAGAEFDIGLALAGMIIEVAEQGQAQERGQGGTQGASSRRAGGPGQQGFQATAGQDGKSQMDFGEIKLEVGSQVEDRQERDQPEARKSEGEAE